ncbi:Protein N-acetyltransferase, RimJ/RimL family [Anaerosphaera aminiphila DSM 21120]|uniref:Protein N-acetyltransferase, RimJ/RimL family n=1 Tax=Anaerosphaera aminiphila DSM 21120 TaxID=1120995 RepID=A0A1M5SC57_9FIRM|nr:GNAT family N-acetyltransferase [Anaerosphaera aminiphila]SHH35493.1 Protein N-acetyltransferase, RimJ/RimL family [Anaerosphaera aminiphila DSM 21120]
MIYSERLIIKKMTLQDVYKFKNWESHESPLFSDYNFDEDSDREIEEWFLWKTSNPRNIYFTIFLKEVPIGYISFKNVNKRKKSAVLGIVIESGKVEKGFGKEVLYRMLNYYFYEWKFEKLYLDVARFNIRAISLYEKMGFKKYSSRIQLYQNREFDLNEEKYRDLRNKFKIILGNKFFYVDKMVLYRNTFDGVVKCISNFKN